VSLFTYALKLSYVGTRYNGWQKQPGDLSTIQGELENALSSLSIEQPVRTLGSGRTDAGVHAFAQVVRVSLDREIEPEKLMKALNSKLPGDIRVMASTVISGDFHPVRDAQNKEYWYLLSDDLVSPFLAPHVVSVSSLLDFKAMNEAAKLFVGEWDFARYQTVGTPVKTTVRTIFEASFEKRPLGPIWSSANISGEVWIFRVKGSGFLKQMVRLMVGSLLCLGKGSVTKTQLRDSLVSPGDKLGAVAPSHGLHLHHVEYEADLF